MPFSSFADFLLAVRAHNDPGTPSHARLTEYIRKAPAGLGEVVDSDGGFLVLEDFANRILKHVYRHNALLALTDRYTLRGKKLRLPLIRETSRANASRWGGLRSQWVPEATRPSLTKPGFGLLTLNPHKLMVLMYSTDELSEDTEPSQGETFLDQYLVKAVADEIDFAVSDAIVNGTGAGTPLGILNSGCTITVSKEGGQAAATIQTENVVKMFARLLPDCNENAAWLVNKDALPQLGSLDKLVAFRRPGASKRAPQATMMGLPVLPAEWCPTLGSRGDIILADLSYYATGVKRLRAQPSIHVRFDYKETVYKFVLRLDGHPWLEQPITPYKGTTMQSCFVTLEART